MSRRTAASAPGKVLLSGGYLVTDRAYRGLVFGLSARMHVVVEETPSEQLEIRVRSPQFQKAEWLYDIEVANGKMQVKQRDERGNPTEIYSASRNKFVETTLFYVLNYITTVGPSLHSVSITILADDDYYSHASTATPCPSNPQSRFRHFNVPLTSAHKTGLGSSAALVTALTASLVLHFIPTIADAATGSVRRHSTPTWQQSIHNLAQAAHCSAQGKIGSGFDVGAAVYGTCIYRRFSPSVLERVGSAEDQNFGQNLVTVVDDKNAIWDADFDASAVRMPSNLRLIMADVDCGSETPGMVRQVMSWRRSDATVADQIWHKLEQGTTDFAAELSNLTTDSQRDLAPLKKVINTIRPLIREMSTLAKVPIEPPAQTRLLDACSRQEGVVGGVVPGAGGYDALALLVENRNEVVEGLARFLAGYTDRGEDDTEKQIGTVRLLGVREEMEGLRSEETAVYEGWL